MRNRDARILFAIISWFFVFMPCSLLSQQLQIRNFTTKEGLSHNQVRTIVSDSSGFLWVATWDGLSRYDGYEFRNYHHLPGTPSSLPYFSVKDLVVDGANNLWVLTDYGHLVLYDRTDDSFAGISEYPFPVTQKNRCIDADSNGDLWIISESNRIIKRDWKTGTFTEFGIENRYYPEINLTEDLSVSKTNANEIWLAGDNLYHLRKPQSDLRVDSLFILLEYFPLFHPKRPVPVDFIIRRWSELFISPTGNKWVFSSFGLFRQESDGQFREFNGVIPDGEFTGDTLYVWQPDNSGINIYDPGLKTTIVVPKENIESNISFCHHDNSMLWFSNKSISGNNIGLTEVIIAADIFNNYGAESKIGTSEAVFPIFKDRDNVIWTGVRGRDHVLLIDRGNPLGKTCILSPELRRISGHLRAIRETRDGIWLGYYNELLLYYDYKTKKFTRHYPASVYFHTLHVNSDGTLYIADNDKIIKYYPDNQLSETIWDMSDNPVPIYCMYSNNRGTLWAGSYESKLLRIDIVNRKTETVNLTEKGYNIENICPGDDNDLWIAFLGGGVCNYNILTGQKKFYTTANGLSNNTTYSILKDSSGKIWVSTNKGISRIDPETGFIRVFGQNDGLNIDEFNSDAAYIAADGKFYFGGMGGIAEFDPDSIEIREKRYIKQKPILTDLKVSGVRKSISGYLNNTDTIVFNKGEDNFHITISSTDFLNSRKTSFRYRLGGIDKEWIETSWQNRNINYANLEPGWYELEIQATDHEGTWSGSRRITINIQPFYYETPLFRIILPLLFLFIIAGIIYLHLRQVKQRETQKQNSLRLQSLRGQMNPHFIFNSLNSINYFISNNDKLSANRYISDFSKLIRSILTNMNHDFISLEEEIGFIEDYLNIEHLRFGDRFDYKVIVDRQINRNVVKVAPGLLQPFLENAIWHGVRGVENRKCKIEVSILKREERLVAIIKDDGSGRKRSELLKSDKNNYMSKGITIVMERLKILNNLLGTHCEIIISDLYPDTPETGTLVEIDIPVAKSTPIFHGD